MTESNRRRTMQLVEQHIIDRDDPRWSALDAACFQSKNLYNAANYLLRQAYIFHQRFIPYVQLDKLMKRNPDYCALPRKVSQWVLKQVDHDWQAFFAALAEWELHPHKFLGRPRLPKYKHKTAGRNLLTYTVQAVGKRAFKCQGVIQPSGLDITIQTQQLSFDQVRIVPRTSHYVVEVVYSVELETEIKLDSTRVAGLDIGLNNLAAVTSNQPGFVPFLVNGRPLKSLNQWFNKERARLQSLLPKGQYTSQRIQALTDNRNRQMKQYLHTTSHRIIERLVAMGIGTLIIGKNDGWKQEISLGKRTNQNFVFIPHAQFIDLLTYKAHLAGMQVIVTEESYTSKCSFLDGESVCKHERYLGKRVKRGLFVASTGQTINADVNGSYNIIRKVIPEAWAGKGIEGAVVHPVRLRPAKQS
jgi:putative transposase